MPHLAELAAKYKGKVTFVAVSDEKVEKIQGFLAQPSIVDGKSWGEAMAYTVATDPDQSTHKAIHRAAGGRGIPASYIIKDGILEWTGHPMGMDKPLEEIVAGKWDREKAKKEMAAQKAIEELMMRLRPKFAAAQASGDWKEVIGELDKAIVAHSDSPELVLTKWRVLLFGAKQEKEAYAMADQLLKALHDNPMALNEVAWTIVDDKNLKSRDLDFAMKAAVRADELTESKDPAILDTLARVHFMKGDTAKALELQRKAVSLAKGDLKRQLEKVLEEYEGALKKN